MNNKTEPNFGLMEKIRYYLNILFIIVLFFLLLVVLSVVNEANGQTRVDVEKKNAWAQANEAAEAFVRVMKNENEDIFLSLLKETECAVVFPSVSEANYLEIKDGRRGMASCRLDNTWGASVFVILKTPVVNKERRISDLVFFFKTREDLTNMLDENAKLGKTITFEAYNSKILKFSSKTDVLIFGNQDSDINVETLNNSSIREGKKFMRKTYGRGNEILEMLKEQAKYAPGELYSFNRSIKMFERGNK